MRQGHQFQTSCFFKKFYLRQKTCFCTLVLLFFGRPVLGHAIKANFVTFQIVDPEIHTTLIFTKRVWE